MTEKLEQRRSAARFEPMPETPADTKVLEVPEIAPRGSAKPPSQVAAASKPSEEESYTSRLLKAKKKVWEDREQK